MDNKLKKKFNDMDGFWQFLFIVKYLIIFSVLSFFIWIITIIIRIFIPYKQYDSFIKENLWNNYIKNTESILSDKNNFPMDFLTENDEKKLLIRSWCDIKSFSYKETIISDTRTDLEIYFACESGITWSISQYKFSKNSHYGSELSRHINLYKEKTNCRVAFKNSSQPEDEGFCWTKRKLILRQ